jgi:hypothetical protein
MLATIPLTVEDRLSFGLSFIGIAVLRLRFPSNDFLVGLAATRAGFAVFSSLFSFDIFFYSYFSTPI